MKKRQLYPFNKNALKGISLAVAIGTIGYCTIDKHINQIKRNKQINHLKNELIKNKANTKTNDQTSDAVANVNEKFPPIAILYLENGDIALLINQEYLSLEAAIQKYPHLTANIREYIAETHGTKTTTAASTLEK